MKSRWLILAFLFMVQAGLYAQNAEDALRYSRIYYGGTARFTGLAGAFGAVGADFSTLATNPAGLGLYKGSELTSTFTPQLAHTTSSYNGMQSSDDRGSFGMGNFGFVFHVNTSAMPGAGPLKGLNFGIGYNRQNDFNSETYISGINMKNSLMQSYVNYLQNHYIQPGLLEYEKPFDIGLAYAANLLVYDSLYGYYCDAAYGGVAQQKWITSYGSINELDFSVSADLNEKLYLGFTFGVPFLSYYENSLYRESRVTDTVPNFIRLDFYNNLHTRGTGINLKFGAIYRPLPWLRVGASVHTPTWFVSMNDSWSSSMHSMFDTVTWDANKYSPYGYYDYKLRTPFRAMASAAVLIGRYGLLSADYEYVNYSQARFKSHEDSFNDVNDEIMNTYRSWGNLKIGTEWRLSDFRLRGGFAYFSNPYRDNLNQSERFQYSAGIGYRGKSFFADFTYVYSKMQQQYYLYDPSMVNPAKIVHYDHSFATTIGFRF